MTDSAINNLSNQSLDPAILALIEPNETLTVENYINNLLEEAYDLHITDIHIEPHAQGGRIRIRQDGILHLKAELQTEWLIRIIARLKILAELNIAEHRLPQDGRFCFSSPQHPDKKIDIRVSTCAFLYGEKIVLRIFNKNTTTLSLQHLGFLPQQQTLFMRAIQQPHGLILVTGPTGSGKTITLYTALKYLANTEKNISSVEDPVEIELEGINQLSIQPQIGLNFSEALRALLRQDPDIMMIGEIRDRETAKIALQAAQTGHLVLATLHANTAKETFARLYSLDLSEHTLFNSIVLTVNQRLVRQLCLHCKEKTDQTYHAQGCPSCYQGYKGRTGIFELYSQDDPTQCSIWDAALEKVKAGITCHSEITRVIKY